MWIKAQVFTNKVLLSSFKHRNYRAFYFGTTVSNIGTWSYRLAQDWLVLDITGSAQALGLVVAAQFVPGMFLSLYGGVLADKFDQRKILMLCNTSGALLALGLGIAVLLEQVNFSIVLLAALGLGVVSGIDGPVRQVYYVRLVGDDDLANSLSWNQISLYFGRLAGPLTAGLLIDSVGMVPAFILNGFSYLVATGAIFLIDPLQYKPFRKLNESESELQLGDQAHSLVAASKHLISNKSALYMISIVCAVAFLGQDMQVTSTLMVKLEFQGKASSLGLLGAIFAAGAICGSLMFARKKVDITLNLLGKRVCYVAGVWILTSIAPSYLSYAALVFMVGYFAMGVNILGNLSIREFIPPVFYGKVWGIYIALWLGALGFGAPMLGLISETFSIRAAIALGGFIALIMGLSTLLRTKPKREIRSNQII